MKKVMCILAALCTLAVSTVVFAEDRGAYCYRGGAYCADSYSNDGGNCKDGACGWRR